MAFTRFTILVPLPLMITLISPLDMDMRFSRRRYQRRLRHRPLMNIAARFRAIITRITPGAII